MRGLAALVIACLLAPAALASPPDPAPVVPAWLQRAAALRTPAYDAGVTAVVLLDESEIAVGEDGSTTTTARYAIRVLTDDGRDAARAVARYVPGASRVTGMRAWLVGPGGRVTAYGEDTAADGVAPSGDLYTESRRRVIAAGEDAGPGAVFGCEWTVEDRPLLAQGEWSFQSRLPVLRSRVALTLPAGWRVRSTTFNHAPVEARVSGRTHAWELVNLAPIPAEPEGPTVASLAPRVALTWFGPAGGPGFASWAEVSTWITGLVADRSAPDATVAARAAELTAGARTDLDRIHAVGRYVQGINYVSIQRDLAQGGGYTPRAAAEVLGRAYGDCKDKANLMVAMLATLGIRAYLVTVRANDPGYVQEAWPSPAQFNHCIVAVSVADATHAPSVVEHPALGRLLVFDPTDPETPVGDLPGHEQGGLALVIAGAEGGLVRLPETPAATGRLVRETEAALAPDGAIAGRIRERSAGQAAIAERRSFEGLARPDYELRLARWIAASMAAARVTRVATADDRTANRFDLDVAFAGGAYARVLEGTLYVFEPALVSRVDGPRLSGAARTQPVVLDAEAFTERARIRLPEGFEVDELPEPVRLETGFGRYEAVCAVEGDTLVFTRSLVVERATVPAAEHARVRAFFEGVREAERAPVVLVRK